MHRRIAFLACPGTLPGSPVRRKDACQHDHQIGALRAGLEGSGVEIVALDWRSPLEVFAPFDLAIIGTVWDYTQAKDEFLARLAALEEQGLTLCNPLSVVRWNADKIYLRDLAEDGVCSIPTLWCETVSANDINAAFAYFGCDRVVAKRRVGAGAVGQMSFLRGDCAITGWQIDQPMMIQPFLPAIATEGEYSFIFIDGHLSHALLKRPCSGDYRIQAQYGGAEVALDPASADRAAAEAIIAILPFSSPLLYARIDMVRRPDGALALIEAELIEPYLYPLQGARFGRIFAEALQQR